MSTTGKFIRADDPTHEALQQLAKAHKLSNTKLLAAMVEYFRVTKADPQQPTAPDLTTSLAKLTDKLAKLDKSTIGFIREQEKTYLKPILAQVQALKVLNAPAPSAPAGLSAGQVKELTEWFMRLFRRTMQPTQLRDEYLTTPMPEPPAQGQQDLSLEPIKTQFLKVFGAAFRPEVLIPPKPKTPPAPAVASPSPAPQP
ncbi:BfmA/BtgA family mobilization protein [Hymenobacter terricola]|uniref:BfmA/BtgA family mobilization protein n=1 Tax=Hymenobacter terricola TaxID=2819236 RepID=UPI001B308E52|nr:BfmA/BtgA family mobilization protein [Hymenobacter terricola]